MSGSRHTADYGYALARLHARDGGHVHVHADVAKGFEAYRATPGNNGDYEGMWRRYVGELEAWRLAVEQADQVTEDPDAKVSWLELRAELDGLIAAWDESLRGNPPNSMARTVAATRILAYRYVRAFVFGTDPDGCTPALTVFTEPKVVARGLRDDS